MQNSLNINLDKIYQSASDALGIYIPKLILAIISLYIGLKVIHFLVVKVRKTISKRNVDESLSHFLGSIISILLKVALIISIIDMVGIKTTSFVAILGAAGLAVGLALQGSLANFAGGTLILLFKPFKTGDYIISLGEEGTVQKIDIFNTWLNKLDNRRVILPNGPLASSTIVNVTAEEKRRVDIAVGLSYKADIDEVKKILSEIASNNPKVLQDPAPFIGLSNFGDSSVNFVFRQWVKAEDYWDVFYQSNEVVKKALDKAKIEIPFPQRDVHIYNHNSQ